MQSGDSSIPVWIQILIYAIPAFILTFEIIKYSLNRGDANKKKPEPEVQMVQGDVFNMDQEFIELLKQQIAAKDREITALRSENKVYIQALIGHRIALPTVGDDDSEMMI